jgi:hypothetical protein
MLPLRSAPARKGIEVSSAVRQAGDKMLALRRRSFAGMPVSAVFRVPTKAIADNGSVMSLRPPPPHLFRARARGDAVAGLAADGGPADGRHGHMRRPTSSPSTADGRPRDAWAGMHVGHADQACTTMRHPPVRSTPRPDMHLPHPRNTRPRRGTRTATTARCSRAWHSSPCRWPCRQPSRRRNAGPARACRAPPFHASRSGPRRPRSAAPRLTAQSVPTRKDPPSRPRRVAASCSGTQNACPMPVPRNRVFRDFPRLFAHCCPRRPPSPRPRRPNWIRSSCAGCSRRPCPRASPRRSKASPVRTSARRSTRPMPRTR